SVYGLHRAPSSDVEVIASPHRARDSSSSWPLNPWGSDSYLPSMAMALDSRSGSPGPSYPYAHPTTLSPMWGLSDPAYRTHFSNRPYSFASPGASVTADPHRTPAPSAPVIDLTRSGPEVINLSPSSVSSYGSHYSPLGHTPPNHGYRGPEGSPLAAYSAAARLLPSSLGAGFDNFSRYVTYVRNAAGRIIGVDTATGGYTGRPRGPNDARSVNYGPNANYGDPHNQSVNPAVHNEEVRNLVCNIKFDESHQSQRVETPADLTVTLLTHQRIGLTWMIEKEESSVRGGILADDMGLGKTIQSMALIVARRPPATTADGAADRNDASTATPPASPPPATSPVTANSSNPDRATTGAGDSPATAATPPALSTRHYATTLIVAPLSLVYQWKREIETKTRPGCLRTYVYHGANRERRVDRLSRYDVVVTTYHLLANECPRETGLEGAMTSPGPLHQIKYWRIILDESQVIKNRTTKASTAVARLEAKHRWCLSGTVLQNSITELYSPIRFLKVRPYCQWEEFRRDISGPAESATTSSTQAFHRIQALLKAVCLRRRKTDTVDGRPILSLPPKTVEEIKTEFSEPEAEFYRGVEERSERIFQRMMDAGTVMRNYANVLVMILRLRQSCCHPHLVLDRNHRDIMSLYDDRVRETGAFADYLSRGQSAAAGTSTAARRRDRDLAALAAAAYGNILDDALSGKVKTEGVDPVNSTDSLPAPGHPAIKMSPGSDGEHGSLEDPSEDDDDTGLDLPSAGEILQSPKPSATRAKLPARLFETERSGTPPAPSGGGNTFYFTAYKPPARWTAPQKKAWLQLSPAAKARLDTTDWDRVECSLCQDLSTTPVILSPCGHVFCEECIETLVNSLIDDHDPTCPHCQAKFTLKHLLPRTLFPDGNCDSTASSTSSSKAGAATLPRLPSLRVKSSKTGRIVPISARNLPAGYPPVDSSPGAGITNDGLAFVPSSKIIRTLEIIRQIRAERPKDKFVVFSQFTQMLVLVSQALARENYAHFIFDGSVAPLEREEMVKRFYGGGSGGGGDTGNSDNANDDEEENEEVVVMLISMKCGSVGLNLCCANHVILLDLWWNPALEDQATDR
ncbi:hypothetical protein IWQ60_012442, partial [Tieghemiomyces parasiticus]